MNIGTYIKEIRNRLGLTQKQLAKKLGKERCTIANYEVGRAIPPGDILLKIQELEASLSKNICLQNQNPHHQNRGL